MITEVLKTGMILLKTETIKEKTALQAWVIKHAKDPMQFEMCCHSKHCEFKLELNDNCDTKNDPA